MMFLAFGVWVILILIAWINKKWGVKALIPIGVCFFVGVLTAIDETLEASVDMVSTLAFIAMIAMALIPNRKKEKQEEENRNKQIEEMQKIEARMKATMEALKKAEEN